MRWKSDNYIVSILVVKHLNWKEKSNENCLSCHYGNAAPYESYGTTIEDAGTIGNKQDSVYSLLAERAAIIVFYWGAARNIMITLHGSAQKNARMAVFALVLIYIDLQMK